MVEHVIACYPEEACGLAAGNNAFVSEIIPVTNQIHSQSRFFMDPQELLTALLQIEKKGLSLLAIFHSHPDGSLAPSQLDLESFSYPGVLYLIWSIADGAWEPRCYEMGHESYADAHLIFEE